MFPAASLITALLLALSIAATPVALRTPRVTLPLAKRINTSGGAIKLVEHDQARAAALKEHGAATQSGTLNRRTGSVSITNEAIAYVSAVGIGSPPTTYNLIVDTASSLILLDSPYTPTGSSTDAGESFSVSDSYGSFNGEEWLDTVTLGPGLVIVNQPIFVSSSTGGISGADGILGLSPEDLTTGTLVNEPNAQIPTVIQTLYTEAVITQEVLGVFFAPTTTEPSTNGELTYGGTDSSKYTGSLTYHSLTTTQPAASYWGINESITYGSTTILSQTAGIIDTGTTLILIASDAFSAYQSATGGTPDASTGLLKFTSAQYSALQNLNFHVDTATYALTPNGQIWPRSLNTYIGGVSGAIYSIVGDIGSPSGQGLDFIGGQTFLERFYSVFDTTNSRVGLATTAYTSATTN